MCANRRTSTQLSRRNLMSAAFAGTAIIASPYHGWNVLASPAGLLQDEPTSGGTLIVGADVSPVGLDPALTTAFASVAIYEHMYSSLLTLEYETNALKPDLAESWDAVDDRTVEFQLRQGVQFPSGRELTAEDVKYTIDRLMDESVAVPLRSYLGPGAAAEVVDDYTVRVSNETAYAPLVSVLADRRPTAIVDREVIEANGSLENWDGGTGPFRLVEYTPDVQVILEKNPNYYEDGLPYLDRIEFRIIPDENARIAAIRAGEVDLTIVKDARLAETLRGDQNIVLNEVPSFWRSGTAINTLHPPLDDVRVRQAISYGINRQELIDSVLLGDGAITGPIPPGETVWAVPATPDSFPTYEYNPDQALQLLDEANVSDVVLSIDASPAYAPDVPSAEVMQAQLRDIGVTLEINQLEFAALLDNQRSGDYDLNLSFNTNRPDPDIYLQPAHSGVSANTTGYSNPEMDELLDSGRATFDTVERQAIYADAQKLFTSEVPILFTYVINNYEPAQPYVRGYTPMASGYRLSLKETWLDN